MILSMRLLAPPNPLHARAIPSIVAVAATALLLVACTSPVAEPAAISTAEPTTEQTEPLMSIPPGDAHWECGHASALMGIQFRSEWEFDNDVIDQAAFDARMDSLVDSWSYLPTGQSEVTVALRTAIEAADAGVSAENAEFTTATQNLVSACDAAGSITILGALPGMGG